MRVIWLATLCLIISPAVGQSTDNEPASRDDIILYLRTMHSHDMIRKMMEVQSTSIQQLLHDQLAKENRVPSDYEVRLKKMMDEMYKGLPIDEMIQAMIPAYQKHFTHGDIAAMNAFYSSPVGQKVLAELPAVTQEGLQEMMPVLSKYLSEWQERMQHEFKDPDKSSPKTQGNAPTQN